MTPNGKIARLPAEIRDQINIRLANGQSGNAILGWLNALPSVQAVLVEQFNASPVNHQNLTNWRHGGFQDWLKQQHRDKYLRELVQVAHSPDPDSLAPALAGAMSKVWFADLAVASQEVQDSLTDPTEKMNRLRGLLDTVIGVRREENRRRRNDLIRDSLAFQRGKAKHATQTDVLDRGIQSMCEKQIKCGALPSEEAGSVSPSPRLAGEEGPNGERAGVRCINTPFFTQALHAASTQPCQEMFEPSEGHSPVQAHNTRTGAEISLPHDTSIPANFRLSK